jgi:calcium-dependent protein kinase
MRNQNGKITLIDFGLATGSKYGFNEDMVVGSPFYIAPEILRGDYDDNFSPEMFSVGTVLFVLAFGKMPFKGKTPDQILENNME